MMVSMFDNAPATSLARDARVVASTNVDWKKTATEHVFKVDLPGLRKEDVKVEIKDGRMLSINGQRKKEEVQKMDTWHHMEHNSGMFMRKFRIPKNANLDQITAKVNNGVLEMVVPKEPEKMPQTRSIEIDGHDGGS